MSAEVRNEPWGATMTGATLVGEELAALIAGVARELRATTPAPRGAPYFGLDIGLDFDPAVLAALSDPGIFRKYELVLMLDSGLAGTARWLSSKLGCRVVAIDADESIVAAARWLNERAHMQEGVRFVVAQGDNLPVRDRSFTHVWFVGDLQRITTERIDAAYRALRPGGQLAFQSSLETIASEEEQLVRRCVEAGFAEVEVRPIVVTEVPPAFRTAQQRMAGVARAKGLSGAGAPWCRPVVELRRLVQVHAHRPSCS